MRALRVVVVAFLTAIAGAVLSVVASQYLTELYHVSNFEGGRGMLIFFALAPLGLTVGFIIGLIVALRHRGTGFGDLLEHRGLHSELRSARPRLFRVFSISVPIIHPNWMAKHSRSSSNLRFHRP